MPANKHTLYLARPLVNKLLAHAQQNPEIEVCGLIGADEHDKKDYYPVENVAENSSCQFLLDASGQISSMKKMRERQQSLFAIVHSHPSADAIPSQLDIDGCNYKDIFHIIVSLNTDGVLEMRAYTQQNDDAQEINLILDNHS